MYCKNCGTEIESNANYCHKCGYHIESTENKISDTKPPHLTVIKITETLSIVVCALGLILGALGYNVTLPIVLLSTSIAIAIFLLIINKKRERKIIIETIIILFLSIGMIIPMIIPAVKSFESTSKENTDENPASNSNNNSQEDTSIQEIHVYTKLISDTMEIIFNNVELTYDVLPNNTDGLYTHYPADVGKVYISIDASVKNVVKQNIRCDEIGKVVADYNNGYKYNGFIVVEDSSTGFTYSNITSITPLETKNIKWLIECPEEIDETTHPLFLIFTIDGYKYKLTIR